MPRGKETMTESQLANIESHKWQKGQSGNPRGKKKDRVKALLKQVLPKSKLKKSEALTLDEINTIEKSILVLKLADLQLLAKADDTPAYAKTLAMAAIIDMKNGKTTTMDRLMDRQYGKPQQKVDITTGGKPIEQGRPLTREEQIEYLKKLEEEYCDDERHRTAKDVGVAESPQLHQVLLQGERRKAVHCRASPQDRLRRTRQGAQGRNQQAHH